MRFQVIKTTDKLLVCSLQCIVRIDFIQASRINQAEHHITKFGLCLFFVHLTYLSFKLAYLFLYLAPYLLTLSPVKPYIAGLFLNAIRFNQ